MSKYGFKLRTFCEYEYGCCVYRKGLFRCEGQFSDGHLAYSRFDLQGNVLESCEWYAMRNDGEICMFHI